MGMRSVGSGWARRVVLVAVAAGGLGAAMGLTAPGAIAARAGAAGRRSERRVTAMTQDTRPLRRAGRWLVDEEGRVVVMHGVNLVQKTAPFYASTITAQDARFLAGQGFDAARLGLIWQGLEPNPGEYDAAYVRRVAALNATLTRYGIRTLLDMHQDAWSAYAQPGIGDGAPKWADLGAGMLQDFQDFWQDDPAPGGVPIQTHFIRGWLAVARSSLGRSANVFGYDPFNEPYAGANFACPVFTPCPAFEAGELAAFYRRFISAIRTVDRRHVIFPEGIAQNGMEQPSLPKFTDSQTAFNFHYYCTLTQEGGPSNPGEERYCAQNEKTGLGNFEAYARRLDVPAILSEFGASAPTDDLERIVLDTGAQFISWTQWAYENDFTNPDAPFTEANADQAELDALVVPYPQTIAGTPGAWNYSYASHVMTMSYRARAVPGARLLRGALTRIFVPERQYPTGYRATVRGAQVVSRPTAPWLMLRTDRPGVEVTVTIRPRAGSATLTPLQTHTFPLPPATRRTRKEQSW